MIKFLSSIRFALILIALTLVLVMAGTFIESQTLSHGSAESWIYHHPLFQILLIGYFINILLSALSRWPFKRRHIPFLITHLGLLMLIGGVFIKNIWGTQGYLRLIEGEAADKLFISNQTAILIERKFPRESYSLPLKKTFFGQFKCDILPKLPFQLLEWQPHAVEKYAAWIIQDQVKLSEKPAWPVNSAPMQIQTKTPVKIWAKKNQSIETALAEIKEHEKAKYLLIHQDHTDKITLIAGDAYQQWDKHEFCPQRLASWIAYDEGFLGYAVAATFKYPDIEAAINNALSQNQAADTMLSPPLQLIQQATPEDFPKLLIAYLKVWASEGTWLFEHAPSQFNSLIKTLDWHKLPSGDVKALYWIAYLFEEKNLLEKLTENHWPLLDALKAIVLPNINLESQLPTLYMTWMLQLYGVKDELPPPSHPISKKMANKMLSAYLRLYGIHYDTIPYNNVPFDSISLESPLTRFISLQPEPSKAEEATPFVKVRWKNEEIPLVFDATGSRLKWPASDQETLLRYQIHQISLPFFVRLHRAQDIKYPGSEQTQSYECQISLADKTSKRITSCTLKMNQVYETAQGYRLYLSGMGNIDSLGVHSVQLVVNRDPAKYWLTYPGGLCLALGICLLFWWKIK